MLRFFLLLCFSLSLFAATESPGDPVYIRPRIWNYSTQVQVDIWNTTQTDIECRGTVHIRGRRSTQIEHYWETIYRGMSRARTYWLRDYQDRVLSTDEFIHCYER